MVQVLVFFELLLLSRWCYLPYAKASCDNAHSNSCRFGGVSLPDKIAVTKRMDDSMSLLRTLRNLTARCFFIKKLTT